MSQHVYYLDRYPLEAHYDACREYMYGKIDWRSKSAEIKEKGVIWFDVSNAIALFPHLELDESYSLICYLSSEYHGLWGRVAALPHGASRTPIIAPESQWLSKLTQGTYFELPEASVFLMEAIYNDGTPEGYFEALLCELFLSALPYAHFEQEHWDIILTRPPVNFNTAWASYADIPDWRPRAVCEGDHTEALIVFRRKIENGIGGSSGKDLIYMAQYRFQSRLGLYHLSSSVNGRKKYRGQIDDDTRYTDKRRCCVSTDSSILIAEEKEYTAKA